MHPEAMHRPPRAASSRRPSVANRDALWIRRVAASVALSTLVAVAAVACASAPAEGSCYTPVLWAAEGQPLSVSPSDTVALVAPNVTAYECAIPDPSQPQPEMFAAEFDVTWTQGETTLELGQITSDGDPVPVEFVVPTDARPGAATVTVDSATLDLEIEG